MILVDANLLIYAFFEEAPEHAAARSWLDDVLSGPARVGLPWESLVAFIRVSANARLWPRPAPVSVGWSQVRDWLNAPPVWTPVPGDAFAEILEDLIPQVRRPSVIHDAHLAALAMEHGLELCSADGDFARFQSAGLRWSNPLSP